MLNIDEANKLVEKLISLRDKANETKSSQDIQEYKKHLNKCVNEFSYIITMRTSRYKAFANYQDLNQEGFEALLKGFKNYNPQKGSIFWWLHKYIDTRIARTANRHTTIRYPLAIAKKEIPHKETLMPTLVEETYCPDKQLENHQTLHTLYNVMSSLNEKQQQIINLFYGFDTEAISINRICQKLHISRAQCIKSMREAHATIKDKIRL